mgnify:CR=1 FL=1
MKEVPGGAEVEYLPNPNTSVAADITSHMKQRAEQFSDSDSGNMQFLLTSQL